MEIVLWFIALWIAYPFVIAACCIIECIFTDKAEAAEWARLYPPPPKTPYQRFEDCGGWAYVYFAGFSALVAIINIIDA